MEVDEDEVDVAMQLQALDILLALHSEGTKAGVAVATSCVKLLQKAWADAS